MLYEIHTGKRHHKLIEDAMAFIVTRLNIPEDVWVDIYVKSLEEGSLGGAVDMEDDGEYHYFELEINSKQSREEIVATLFHEMKHVEQTATGRLDQFIWEGKDYSNVDYMDRPWEKEAYAFEHRTVYEYKLR